MRIRDVKEEAVKRFGRGSPEWRLCARWMEFVDRESRGLEEGVRARFSELEVASSGRLPLLTLGNSGAWEYERAIREWWIPEESLRLRNVLLWMWEDFKQRERLLPAEVALSR